MSVDRPIVRKAAQLVALANELRRDGLGDVDGMPHPVFWPALHAHEARGEWEQLRRWVDQLQSRFPHLTRIPECWWRHNDLVEILAALRDFERACYGPIAPATAAVEWHRALRDMELRMELWIKRFSCSVAGRGHTPLVQATDDVPEGWVEFVDCDIDHRHRREPSPGHTSFPDIAPIECTNNDRGDSGDFQCDDAR